MLTNYESIYNQDYFSGKTSFFWHGGYGGYGVLSKFYFSHLYLPIEKIVKTLPKTSTVLDVGCAYGFMLERFPKSFSKYGIDVSEHAIAEARKRFPTMHFTTGNIEDVVPFETNFFDLIIFNDVLEHLEKTEIALHHIYEALKPSGILYITTPNLNGVRKLLFKKADELEHHVSLQTHDQLVEKTKKAKLTILNNWTFTHFIPFVHLPAWFGIESAVVAQK